MHLCNHQSGAAMLSGFAALLLAGPVQAQQFYATTNSIPARAGYVGGAGYYPGYGYNFGDPYGGYLNGTASVINAQGGYLIQTQQAYLEREKVRNAQLQNRRAAFDEWKYEKANTPTLEEQREETRMQNVMRSRINPPITEIWSGKALNDLLVQLQQMQATGLPVPAVYLNQELLPEINVTSGATSSGFGMLKTAGKWDWPMALTDDKFVPSCKKIEDLTAAAVQTAVSGPVPGKTLREITNAVDNLQAEVKSNVANIAPNDYIRAKRFLNDLSGSIQTLQDPNATKYLTGQWVARGHTVADLVGYMTEQGLRFAPATPGTEAAYNSVQRALATSVTMMSQMMTKR